MYSVNVTVRGISPLMQHRYSLTAAKKASPNAGQPDHSGEWRDALYADKNGIYQPSDHLLGTMTKAAAAFKISGKRGKSFKDLIQSSIVITPDHIPHNMPVPAELDDDADKPLYVDVRPVVVVRARVLRYRPMFHAGWSLSFVLEVADDDIPVATLNEILAYAGKAVGIGDFRPRFGRFMVERFEVTK